MINTEALKNFAYYQLGIGDYNRLRGLASPKNSEVVSRSGIERIISPQLSLIMMVKGEIVARNLFNFGEAAFLAISPFLIYQNKYKETALSLGVVAGVELLKYLTHRANISAIDSQSNRKRRFMYSSNGH